MSKVRVTIDCTQVVRYQKEIVITQEEYEMLKDREGATIYALTDADEFNLLDSWIDASDIYEADQEFELGNVLLEGDADIDEDEEEEES